MKFSSELLKMIEGTYVTVLCDLSVSERSFTRVFLRNFHEINV